MDWSMVDYVQYVIMGRIAGQLYGRRLFWKKYVFYGWAFLTRVLFINKDIDLRRGLSGETILRAGMFFG